MNKFSVWTYGLILSVLLLGILYSLPNIYPAKPSIQIAYSDSGMSADQSLLERVSAALDASEVAASAVKLDENNIVANFTSLDDQLRAKTILQRSLLDDAVVALNLEPSTPAWLEGIGGSPLKLGLDLSGGVHFLLEVDIESAVSNRLEGILNSFRQQFREEGIRYSNSVNNGSSIRFTFNNEEGYTKARGIINNENVSPNGLIYDLVLDNFSNTIELTYTDVAIREIRDYAVGQNLMTLRNRVNELGVSEPIVQRQGRDRIVVQLPGVQDTTAAKKIIGKTANLEFRMEASMRNSRFAVLPMIFFAAVVSWTPGNWTTILSLPCLCTIGSDTPSSLTRFRSVIKFCPTAVGQNLMTLRNRVNELGVSEPIVQRQGRDRIVVQLPGVQDTTAAKKIIGKTANLEFRMEASMRNSRFAVLPMIFFAAVVSWTPGNWTTILSLPCRCTMGSDTPSSLTRFRSVIKFCPTA